LTVSLMVWVPSPARAASKACSSMSTSRFVTLSVYIRTQAIYPSGGWLTILRRTSSALATSTPWPLSGRGTSPLGPRSCPGRRPQSGRQCTGERSAWANASFS
jgi:hypothetical protein